MGRDPCGFREEVINQLMHNKITLYRISLFIIVSILLACIIWNEQWELSSTPVIHDTIYSMTNISSTDDMQSY
jgi:hypothetical protein